MLKLLWLIVLFPFAALAEDSTKDTEMRLYLTSAAINVMDELVPRLPFQTHGHTACYITTASNLEGNPSWVDDEIHAVEKTGLNVRRVDLAELSPDTVDSAFAGCDIIWVGGGNTYLLLQEVRRSGFDELVIKKIAAGVPYVGTSAGSLIVAPNIECIRFAEEHPDLDLTLTSFDGLNIFPLATFVHFDNPDYREVYMKIMADALENDVAFVTLRDNQFVFVDGDSWSIINSKSGD